MSVGDIFMVVGLIAAATLAAALTYAAIWRFLFEFNYNLNLKRRRASRALTSTKKKAEYLVRHELTLEDAWMEWRRKRREKRFWHRLNPDEYWKSRRPDTKRAVASEETIELIRKLVRPWPHDALLLDGIFEVPFSLFHGLKNQFKERFERQNWNRPRLPEAVRKEIAKQGVQHELVKQAANKLIRIMENAGFLPLVHSHVDGSADYVFHAKGIENSDFDTHAHKLFFRPATTMPHLPFNHTVSGDLASRHAGTIAPDIVAFLIIDQSDDRRNLGPRLYWLDKLLVELGKETVSLLRQKDFQIIPDQSIKDNKHGAINSIELFGHGNDETQFMRFDYARVEPAAGTASIGAARRAIWALRRALDKKSGPFLEETDLLPGDVLLVNNWRVATAWDEEALTNRKYKQAVHVHAGDRLVYQAHFYYPREPAPPKHNGHGGDDHH